jgi:hypothetical protein
VQRHRDVHDASTPGRAQVWKRGLRTEERAGQVDLDDAPPRVRAHRFGRRVKVAGRVVDEQIETAVALADLAHHGAHTFGIPNV